jgi:hypothetical protein
MPRTGKARLQQDFQKLVHEKIYDETLAGLLQAAKADTTKWEEALRHLKLQIGAGRRALLYPQQAEIPDALAQLMPAYQPPAAGTGGGPEPAIDVNVLEECWQLIISDATHAALALREAFERSRQETQGDTSIRARVQLRIRAERVLRALHYVLHALLYQLRARANETGGIAAPTTTGKRYDLTPATGQRNMVRMFADREDMIAAVARSWGIARALPRGEFEAIHALNYGMWSHEFVNISEDELGWGRFSHRIGVELRYSRYSFELSQRWAEVGSPPIPLAVPRVAWALLVEAFKGVAGFGLKPVRFATTAVLTLLLFTTLYCLNDIWVHIALTRERVAHNLYIAIVYLTSVGSGSQPQGFAPVLIAVESVLGYFLLSVLAAMLFAWFTDR